MTESDTSLRRHFASVALKIHKRSCQASAVDVQTLVSAVSFFHKKIALQEFPFDKEHCHDANLTSVFSSLEMQPQRFQFLKVEYLGNR
jgi:hypothetical protein